MHFKLTRHRGAIRRLHGKNTGLCLLYPGTLLDREHLLCPLAVLRWDETSLKATASSDQP
eukprot:3314943-Pleurochrysis_carterae.AAC.5